METFSARTRTLLGVLSDGYQLAGRKHEAARLEVASTRITISTSPKKPPDDDCDCMKASPTAPGGNGFDVSIWDCMTTIVDAEDHLREFDKVQAMLKQMKQWLKDNGLKKDDSTSGYPAFEGRYKALPTGVLRDTNGAEWKIA